MKKSAAIFLMIISNENFQKMSLLESFYELTLESLKHAKNERLWFKTNTKLANLYLQNEDWNNLSNVLKVSSNCRKIFFLL